MRYYPRSCRELVGNFLIATMAASVLAGCGGGGSPQTLPFTGSKSAAIEGNGSAPTQALSALSSPAKSKKCDKKEKNDDPSGDTLQNSKNNGKDKDKGDDHSGCTTPSPSVKIYVATGGGVTTYNADGTQTTPTIPAISNTNTTAVAVDAAGKIYVLSRGIIDPSKTYLPGTEGDFVTTYNPDGTQTTPTITAGLFDPFGIAVDAAGKIYVANFGRFGSGYSVTTYNPDGTETTPTITAGLFVPSSGVAVDADGKIYVNSGANITTYKSDGTQTTPTIAAAAAGIAYAAGRIYVVSGTPTTGSVTTYKPDGTQTTPTITAGLISPLAVAVDSAGNIYVLNDSAHSVMMYGPNGIQKTPTISTGLTLSPGFRGIAVH